MVGLGHDSFTCLDFAFVRLCKLWLGAGVITCVPPLAADREIS